MNPDPITDPLIRAVQTFVGVKPDGSPGPITWKAIYAKLTGKAWVAPEPAPGPDIPGIEGFPQEAVSMILEAEGIDQPRSVPKASPESVSGTDAISALIPKASNTGAVS